MAHGEHAQAAQFFGGVEDDGRESRRHLRVESYFNSRLDLVLALDLRASEVNMSRRWRAARVDAVVMIIRASTRRARAVSRRRPTRRARGPLVVITTTAS